MRTPNKNSEKTWKEKAKLRGGDVRRLKQEKKRQHARAEKWKQLYYELKHSQKQTRVKHQPYPLEFMWLAVWMHIQNNVSLRGVSKSLCKVGELYGLKISYISPSTIRNWCLRFGLYCLLQPKKMGDYALILDESIEIGKEHLLALLIVRIDTSSPISPLCLQDVQVLHVSVQPSWKSKEVISIIKKQQQQQGLHITYGISDKDSMLRKSLAGCGLAWISDCTHEMANSAQAIFKKDEAFNGFIQQLNALRAKWILSKHNFYIPPGLRQKTRFHQLFVVHKWAQYILANWSTIPPTTQSGLMFVKQSKQLVQIMADMYYLIEGFSKIFKAKGIQDSSIGQWKHLVEQYRADRNNGLSDKAESFIGKMNDYIARQQAKLPSAYQILCCSDIIESVFGKYKNKGGAKIITDDVLKIAAYPEKKDLLDVKKAMESIKCSDLMEWKKKNTTVSKLAIIKRNNKSKHEKSAA